MIGPWILAAKFFDDMISRDELLELFDIVRKVNLASDDRIEPASDDFPYP